MNRLSFERQRDIRRASLGAALAAIATAIVVFGPPPSVMADLMHQVRGNESAVEQAVERVAAETYDTSVFAHCAPTEAPVLGQASTLYHTIRLNPSVCRTLGSIIANPEAADPLNADNALAVLSAAHEFSHVNGGGLGKEYDEGVTQCVGVQRAEEVAEALGIPADNAKIVGDLAEVAASAPPTPEYAIPSGCVDGGPYDINALGDHFPQDPIEAFLNGD